jgi:hypothetical protein
MPLVEAPPDDRTAPIVGSTTARVAPLLPRSTWLGLALFGGLLFAVGVYVGLVANHLLRSTLPATPLLNVLPFVFTIGGGALAAYGYTAWEDHPDGPAGDDRRRAEQNLRDLPSFEIYRPPREGSP